MSIWLSKFNEWENGYQALELEKKSISMVSSLCIDTLQAYSKPKQSPSDIVTLQSEHSIIETTQQFLSWFSKIENEMKQGQEDHFK
jgi:hypothetical protein